MAAGINHAAHSCNIADPEFGYGTFYLQHLAHNLVTWNNGINFFFPIAMHQMNVAVTNAAIQNSDKDVMLAYGMTSKLIRLEITVFTEQGISFGRDASLLC